MKEENTERRYFDYDENGVVNIIPFYDAPTESKGNDIELTFEEWQKYSCHPTYSYFIYENGKISEKINESEKQKVEKASQIMSYKSYLDSTDYVISKLNELKLEDEEEYEKAKEEYNDVLAKRKEARSKINELEG